MGSSSKFCVVSPLVTRTEYEGRHGNQKSMHVYTLEWDLQSFRD